MKKRDIKKYKNQIMDHVESAIDWTVEYVRSHKKLLIAGAAVVLLYKWLFDEEE